MAVNAPAAGARTALAVMARYPAVGQVKTRLARVIGAEPACRLYRAFLHDIESRFRSGCRTLVWLFHPPGSEFTALMQPGAQCVPQAGNDLGGRMLNAFRDLCDKGFEHVIMVGADVPHVRAEWLDQADEQLGHCDVVLGPSDDGGYYLVAMRQPHDVFSEIEMSTSRVLQDTLRKAATLGLRAHLLPATFDIDEARDLDALAELLGGRDRVDLPHTFAVLTELRAAGLLPLD